MLKKKVLALTMGIIMIAGALAGCGSTSSSESTKETASEKKDVLKVGMVTDIAGVNDQAFNQSCWEGLKAFKGQEGYDVSYVESKQDADYQPNLDSLLDAKNDLIWGVGFKMADTLKKAAESNQDQKYAIADISYDKETPKNVVCVTFKAEESGFLIGFIAGKTTKTNKIGFIGGMDVPVVNAWKYGFMAGIKQANPNATVDVQYAESFTDAAKGKAMAKQMYMNGIDVVFAAAGNVTDGAIEAAKEQNKWVICGDQDQSNKAPKNILCCGIKNVQVAVESVVKDLKDGKFEGGTTKVYGLKEGGTGIAPTASNTVAAEVLTAEKEIEKKISNGEIVPPSTKEEFDKFQVK